MKGEERPVCGPEKIERRTDRCEASQSRQTLQRQPGSLEFLEDVSPLIPEASSVLTDRWGLLAFNLCGVDKTLSVSLGSPESKCESVLEIVALLASIDLRSKMPWESLRSVWDASQRRHVSGRSTLLEN